MKNLLFVTLFLGSIALMIAGIEPGQIKLGTIQCLAGTAAIVDIILMAKFNS